MNERLSDDGALRLRRIRRVSRAMAWCVSLGAAALLILFLWFWHDPALLGMAIGEMTGLSVTGDLTPLAHWGAFAAACLPFGLALWGLWLTRRLFLGYARGEILTRPAARRLAGLGALLLGTVLAGILARTLAVLALTWENPPGQRQLAISLNSHDFGLAVLGFLLLVVGWILGEAARLAEENQLFV
ncbi:MAG: hypothetical protein Kilf2KO_43340 [Rhodospirillales bacterium]